MSEEHAPALIPGNGARILLAIVWPGIVLLAIIMLGSVGLVLGIALVSSGDPDVARLVGEARAISRLVALLIIVPAIVMLALVDKIDRAATIAVLGAIAGYVLGGTTGGGTSP